MSRRVVFPAPEPPMIASTFAFRFVWGATMLSVPTVLAGHFVLDRKAKDDMWNAKVSREVANI